MPWEKDGYTVPFGTPGATQQVGRGGGQMGWKPPSPPPPPPAAPAPSAPASSGGGGGGGGSVDSGDLDKWVKKAENVKPREREVEPEDTVAFQLDQLLDRNSPYMQRARYAGEKFAQARGLQNTSMAGEASQAAAIDAALPIAASDANTYFSQGINNQNTVNRFKENLQGLYGSLALGSQSFMHNSSLLGQEIAGRLELARIASVSSIFSTPGLTAEQQEFGVSRILGLYNNSGSAIQNFQSI